GSRPGSVGSLPTSWPRSRPRSSRSPGWSRGALEAHFLESALSQLPALLHGSGGLADRLLDAADHTQLVRPPADVRRSLRRGNHGARAIPAVYALRPLRRGAHGPARRATACDRDADRAARHRGRADVDRGGRLRAAVDALHRRVPEWARTRARRAVAPAADVQDGG